MEDATECPIFCNRVVRDELIIFGLLEMAKLVTYYHFTTRYLKSRLGKLRPDDVDDNEHFRVFQINMR